MANKAYKFRLYPSEEQKILFAKTFGCVRFIYNQMLSDKIAHYKETGMKLNNTPAQYKKEFEWLKEVDSLALANAQMNLQTAYNNFFRTPKVGFPKFKERMMYVYNYKKYVICVAVALVMGVGAAMAYAENNKREQSHEIIADSSSYFEGSSSLNESSLNASSESSKIEIESKPESSSNAESSEIEDSSFVEILPNNEVVTNEPIVVTTPIVTETIPTELGEAVEDTTPVLVEETPREVATVADYAPSDLYNQGRLYWGDYQYTWYSENVLPGYGLAIEGRYTDADGFVCDGDGYICVAASSLSKGTVVDTPFGRQGKVYDTGCDWGVIDCYTSW